MRRRKTAKYLLDPDQLRDVLRHTVHGHYDILDPIPRPAGWPRDVNVFLWADGRVVVGGTARIRPDDPAPMTDCHRPGGLFAPRPPARPGPAAVIRMPARGLLARLALAVHVVLVVRHAPNGDPVGSFDVEFRPPYRHALPPAAAAAVPSHN